MVREAKAIGVPLKDVVRRIEETERAGAKRGKR
jgi:hypothetical protein